MEHYHKTSNIMLVFLGMDALQEGDYAWSIALAAEGRFDYVPGAV